MESAKRKVLQGTCGWSDSSLVQCGRFFPPRTSSTIDKLRYLSREGGFGCVEVNSSTYSIPQEWVDTTSPAFIFHFKAFGLFCGSDIPLQSIPPRVRESFELTQPRISSRNLSMEAMTALWSEFNSCLEPVIASGKMGCVIFQFHTSFNLSDSSKRIVELSATSLRDDVVMAVEFRNRTWLGWPECVQGECDEAVKQNTLFWLKSLRNGKGVVLVASDELVGETYPAADCSQWETCEGISTPVLPTVLTAMPCGAAAYIRIHRRQGVNRILSSAEINNWAQQIRDLMTEERSKEDICDKESTSVDEITVGPALDGPCYVLWGTDHEDQPIINMGLLHDALDPLYQPPRRVKSVKKGSSGANDVIQNMFKQAGKRKLSSLPMSSGGSDVGDSIRTNSSSTSMISKKVKKQTITSFFRKKSEDGTS